MCNAGYAMCGSCSWEPVTREEKIAMLEAKEGMLEKKLEYVRKMKEAVTAEKGKEK